jgi:hypothetical protein
MSTKGISKLIFVIDLSMDGNRRREREVAELPLLQSFPGNKIQISFKRSTSHIGTFDFTCCLALVAGWLLCWLLSFC